MIKQNNCYAIFLAPSSNGKTPDSALNHIRDGFRAAINRSLIWFMAGSGMDTDGMHYVYALWSKIDQEFYIGYTNDIKRRIAEHKSGQCYTSLRMTEPKLIFYEGFLLEDDARRREGYFKTTKGKKTLRIMLRESIRE